MTTDNILQNATDEQLGLAMFESYERIGFRLTNLRINRYLWRNE